MKGTKKTKVTKKSTELEDDNNDLFFISTAPSVEIKPTDSGNKFEKKLHLYMYLE